MEPDGARALFLTPAGSKYLFPVYTSRVQNPETLSCSLAMASKTIKIGQLSPRHELSSHSNSLVIVRPMLYLTAECPVALVIKGVEGGDLH